VTILGIRQAALPFCPQPGYHARHTFSAKCCDCRKCLIWIWPLGVGYQGCCLSVEQCKNVWMWMSHIHISTFPGSPPSPHRPLTLSLPRSMQDPLYPFFPVAAFLGFSLSLVPLPWHLQAWNAGTCMYMFWASTACLVEFVNAIVWRNTAMNFTPIWCDIGE
jgi:hypothetical protein